jgi:phosphoribosylglycinamide formyltransferase-1
MQHLATKLAILISGHGSNMASLAAACRQEHWPAQVVVVIASRPDAPGIARAHELGLPVEIIASSAFTSRESFDAALIERLDALEVDLVVLAGFMRILTDGFVRHFAGRLINIHPSLLPAFVGLDTHARALATGVRLHGATAHLVTPELDHGPIIAQAVVPVLDGDDAATLAARVLRLEHILLPRAVRWMVEGRVQPQAHQGRVVVEGIDDAQRLIFDAALSADVGQRATGAHAGTFAGQARP